MYLNCYNLYLASVTSCLVGTIAFEGSWEDGLRQCDENLKTRSPTMEDVHFLLQDSWLYAAAINLPKGDSTIIIMKSRQDKNKICEGSCNETCQLCNTGIVFNNSRASIEPHLRNMIPGKHFILQDNAFEDYPKPDKCMVYLLKEKTCTLRDCNETRPVVCLNDSSTFETTACYQQNTQSTSCFSLPQEERTRCNEDVCTAAGLFRESYVYVVTVVSAILIYGLLNIICIKCSVRHLVKRTTHKASVQRRNGVPNEVGATVHMYTHL